MLYRHTNVPLLALRSAPRSPRTHTIYYTHVYLHRRASLPQSDKECTGVKAYPNAGASTPFETNAYAFGKYSGGNVTLKE